LLSFGDSQEVHPPDFCSGATQAGRRPYSTACDSQSYAGNAGMRNISAKIPGRQSLLTPTMALGGSDR